ncbi:MAG: OmpA family protein [Candidatus Sumerlaeia bacterium]|nr:OmpA family protein [Candidatus Sumerlaeia bacterium]
MSRTFPKALSVMALALLVLGAVAVPAADDYSVPRIPTQDREVRGNLAFIDNFFSGITGAADNVTDLVMGAGGIVAQSAGQVTLLVSDVVGLVDDNFITRTVTQGYVSSTLATAALIFTRTGDDLIEISHGLKIPCLPIYREYYLRQDDGGAGVDYIDYLHIEGGWGCLWRVPLEIIAVGVGDGVIRPVGNVLRLVSLPQSDDLENFGLQLIESSLCVPNCSPDVVEVPVVEVREVPVETEVVREVHRTITTERYSFRDVLFRYDDDQLTPMGERVCDQIAEALGGRNIQSIQVQGHTCDLGTDEYNMDLGQRRANTVADALAARGLDANVMEVTSLGEADPIVPNESDVLRALNRRVEVVVTYVEETQN